MPLEKQVCSLGLAKELKELGVKQDSYFIWANNPYEELDWDLINIDVYETSDEYDEKTENDCSAFTVAELGEMLGSGYNSGRDDNKKEKCFCEDTSMEVIDTRAETEADARAKMLIYLIKNNLIQL